MYVHYLKSQGNIKGICSLLSTCFNLYIYLYSYRIKNAIERKILAIPNPRKKYLLQQRIIRAIVIHRKAIESVYFYYKTLCKIFYLRSYFSFITSNNKTTSHD